MCAADLVHHPHHRDAMSLFGHGQTYQRYALRLPLSEYARGGCHLLQEGWTSKISHARKRGVFQCQINEIINQKLTHAGNVTWSRNPNDVVQEARE